MSVLQLVESLIAENFVVVFSKAYCPYCIRAKDLLKSLNVKFCAIELDARPDGSQIQSQLAQMTKQRTVPNIFINKKHVGGCDDLFELVTFSCVMFQ